MGVMQRVGPRVLDREEKRGTTLIPMRSHHMSYSAADGFSGSVYRSRPRGLMIPSWGLELAEGRRGRIPSNHCLAQRAGPTRSLQREKCFVEKTEGRVNAPSVRSSVRFCIGVVTRLGPRSSNVKRRGSAELKSTNCRRCGEASCRRTHPDPSRSICQGSSAAACRL